jgi:hypothetical protein
LPPNFLSQDILLSTILRIKYYVLGTGWPDYA